MNVIWFLEFFPSPVTQSGNNVVNLVVFSLQYTTSCGIPRFACGAHSLTCESSVEVRCLHTLSWMCTILLVVWK